MLPDLILLWGKLHIVTVTDLQEAVRVMIGGIIAALEGNSLQAFVKICRIIPLAIPNRHWEDNVAMEIAVPSSAAFCKETAHGKISALWYQFQQDAFAEADDALRAAEKTPVEQ